MIRLLLAVTVAAALLSASLPAVTEVRTDRTADDLNRAGDRLVAASQSLLAADDADVGARRVVRFHLPAGSLTLAGVERVVVSCRPNCVLRYRLEGGRTGRRPLGTVPLATPDGRVALSRPGTHRVTLRLTRFDGRRTVTVRG